MNVHRKLVRIVIGGCAVLAICCILAWYLRQPPAVIAKIERLGGQIDTQYEPDSWPLAEPLGLRRFQSPHRVQIDSDQFTDDDLGKLASFGTVSELSIRSSTITDRGVKSLTSESPDALLPGVISGLRLDCPNVTDEGLATLRRAVLVDLTVVGGPGVRGEFVSEWRDSRTLQFLALHGASITDEVVDRICRLERVENVDLSNTGVTDARIEKFAEMPSLIRLNVKGTKVTGGGVQRLVNSLRRKVVIISDWDGHQGGELY